MSRSFRNLLETARGRSEWVIVVVCDVRGFSDFSRHHESPDIAMYIKRLYLQLLDKFFPGAGFVKPTGDGLLLIFPFTEDTLTATGEQIIKSCLACVDEFPSICEGDPMINFSTPPGIGFGVTRGPACCLFSGKVVLDYSGHLLNLAARLADLARPKGVLLDGMFKAVSDETLKSFRQENIYIRSVAEQDSVPAYLSHHVQLPDSAFSPPQPLHWQTVEKSYALATLKKSGTFVLIHFDQRATSKQKVHAEVSFPNPDAPGHSLMLRNLDFAYDEEAAKPGVRIFLAGPLGVINERAVPDTEQIVFRVEYVPKDSPIMRLLPSAHASDGATESNSQADGEKNSPRKNV